MASPFLFAAADPNTGFLLAVRSNKIETVRSDLVREVDVNQADKEGYTALMYSVMYGFHNKEMVDVLLAHQAQVNVQTNNGMTALMLAAGAGSGGAGPEIVGDLLDHHADPNLKNNSGMTALMYAEARPEIIKLLRSRGAVEQASPQYRDGGHTSAELTFEMRQRAAPANPSDHPDWLACDSDQDCTSIQAGCRYWQPSNRRHVSRKVHLQGRSLP